MYSTHAGVCVDTIVAIPWPSDSHKEACLKPADQTGVACTATHSPSSSRCELSLAPPACLLLSALVLDMTQPVHKANSVVKATLLSCLQQDTAEERTSRVQCRWVAFEKAGSGLQGRGIN